MAHNGRQRKFEDPIQLPNGRQLVTLKDAADYITSLPKKETDLPDWQVAMQALLLVSRSGPTMLARIAVMKALNRHVDPGPKTKKVTPSTTDTRRGHGRQGCQR